MSVLEQHVYPIKNQYVSRKHAEDSEAPVARDRGMLVPVSALWLWPDGLGTKRRKAHQTSGHQPRDDPERGTQYCTPYRV